MLPAADVERARVRASDAIAADIPLKRAGSLQVASCPFHGPERTPSFTLYPDGHFHCFSCSAHGDGIGYVMRRRGLAFPAAVAWLLDLPEHYQIARATRLQAPPPRETESGTADRVRAILAECGPVVEGTAAHLYLWTRGLKPTPALLAHPALYCSEIDAPLPALVAPIVGRGEPTALQRIWCVAKVEYNGSNPQADARASLTTRKKTLGIMSDGAVRLAPAGPVLGLAEGVETGLAAMQLYRVPVWAVCGAARLGHVWVPDTVRSIIVMGDNGDTGHALAERAVNLWRERGMAASAVYPPERFDDFNSQLRG